jgi:hypothetical protein
MKSNFSNQNHGSLAIRNASITFYHNGHRFDTSSSQRFVQGTSVGAGFSLRTVIFLGRTATPTGGLENAVTGTARSGPLGAFSSPELRI